MSRKVLVSLALLAVIIPAASGGQTRPRTAVAASFAVSTTDDSGPGSLRRAVSDANAAPGPDTITFAIPGAGPHVISLLGAINIQDEGTTIDASGKSIIFDGSSAPSPSNLFQVSASSVTFIGFTVRNAPSKSSTVSRASYGACAGSVAIHAISSTRPGYWRPTVVQQSGWCICSPPSAANIKRWGG